MSDRERANFYADLIIHKKMTIREVAKFTGVSKSTVHKYISEYTTGRRRIHKLRRQLQVNWENGIKKGALATKRKWAKVREGCK